MSSSGDDRLLQELWFAAKTHDDGESVNENKQHYED